MKALLFLKDIKNYFGSHQVLVQTRINEAIAELEELQEIINTSIEEIEYALSKPQYADVYLNNAIRFLKMSEDESN